MIDSELRMTDSELTGRYANALYLIAAYTDTGASRHLQETKSYSMFDEPGSVQTAREALSLSAHLTEALIAEKAVAQTRATPPLDRIANALERLVSLAEKQAGEPS